MTTSGLYQHPSYDSTTQDFNYCLIQVESSISTEAISQCSGDACTAQACIPTQTAEPGDACWVAGWGSTGGANSNVLISLGINIMSEEYCTEHSAFNTGDVTATEICAGLPDSDENGQTDGGSGVCNGDNGGPLVCNVSGKVTLVGVISRGFEGDCASENNPAIFASVFSVTDWITSTIENPPVTTATTTVSLTVEYIINSGALKFSITPFNVAYPQSRRSMQR